MDYLRNFCTMHVLHTARAPAQGLPSSRARASESSHSGLHLEPHAVFGCGFVQGQCRPLSRRQSGIILMLGLVHLLLCLPSSFSLLPVLLLDIVVLIIF